MKGGIDFPETAHVSAPFQGEGQFVAKFRIAHPEQTRIKRKI